VQGRTATVTWLTGAATVVAEGVAVSVLLGAGSEAVPAWPSLVWAWGGELQQAVLQATAKLTILHVESGVASSSAPITVLATRAASDSCPAVAFHSRGV
jgi:hypothetical protein